MFYFVLLLSLATANATDVGANQAGSAKLLPVGIGSISLEAFQGRFGVVVPGNPNAYFDRPVQALTTRACYGIVTWLEACGEATGQKAGQQLGFGFATGEAKILLFNKSYIGGEFQLSSSFKARTGMNQTFPLSSFRPSGSGNAEMRYGPSYSTQVTAFASKYRFAGQGWVNYQLNTTETSFSPGNTTCGGGSLYVSLTNNQRPNSLSVATDGWYCRQSASVFSGRPFDNGRQVVGVGPALILILRSNWSVKAAYGFLPLASLRGINLDPTQNNGWRLSVSYRFGGQ